MQDTTSIGETQRDGSKSTRISALDLLLVLVLTAGFLLLLRVLVGGRQATGELILGLLALQNAIPIAIVYMVIIRGRGLSWFDVGLRPVSSHWYGRAVLIAIATLPLVALVNYGAQTLAGEPFANPQLEVLSGIGFSWPRVIGVLALTGIAAPIVEEIVFRGLLYGWLRGRAGIVAGMAVSAIVFALAHGVLMLVPALAVYGVILAGVYERSGSLWPPIIVHGVFNALMTLAFYATAYATDAPAFS